MYENGEHCLNICRYKLQTKIVKKENGEEAFFGNLVD